MRNQPTSNGKREKKRKKDGFVASLGFEYSSVKMALWSADDYRDLRMYAEARGQSTQTRADSDKAVRKASPVEFYPMRQTPMFLAQNSPYCTSTTRRERQFETARHEVDSLSCTYTFS